MHKLLSTLLSLLFALTSWAQISVASFKLDPQDLSAINPSTAVLDQNGYKCALIRVQTTQSGFTFDTGSLLPPEKIDYSHTAEIWLYVPYGVRQINIAHPQLGRMKEWYEFPMPVEKARTYILELVTGEVKTIVEQSATNQYVVFNINPPEAMVTLDGNALITEGGTAQKYLPFGTYEWNVELADYHSQSGTVTVSDPDNPHTVNVELKPAFGWLNITADETSNGASVFLDNKPVGKVPYKSPRLASGQHTVKIVNRLYSDKVYTVDIADNETYSLVPHLDANFANVQITVADNAEIWINGELKGRGRWSGPLEAQDYVLEAKALNHRTTKTLRTITPTTEQQDIALEAPQRITGSVNVGILPSGAEVLLDGKLIGQTPRVFRDILIGNHNITVRKNGYGDLTQTITVTEGNTTDVEGKLPQSTDVTLTTNNSKATIYIDGENRGIITSTYNLGYGEHRIELKAEGYKDFATTINVTQTDKKFQLRHEPIFGPKTFTVNDVSFTMIPVVGGTFNMGATSEQQNPDSDEKPVHSVTLSNYMIGETEVTQELWQAVMGNNPSYFKGANKPVENVSWNDCQKFIQKLNKLTGQHFRLPTEAEWEYAARGGKQSKVYQYSGSNNIGDVAWYDGNSNRTTHPVKTKQSNELGIYDMSGNVEEWCLDWQGDYSSAQSNPTGPSSGLYRVFRGGDWDGDNWVCRSAHRYYIKPDDYGKDLGLRLALSTANDIHIEKKNTESKSILTGTATEQEEKDKRICAAIRNFIVGKPNAAVLTNRAKQDLVESTWPELQCSVDGMLDSPKNFKNLVVKKVGDGQYKYECVCPDHGDKFIDFCTIHASEGSDGIVRINRVTWDDASTQSLSNLLRDAKWYNSDYGFKMPDFMTPSTDIFVEDMSASLQRWTFDDICVACWPTLASWAVIDYPAPNMFLTENVLIKNVTYTNGARTIFSGYATDGRIWYMKKKVISGREVSHANILVLLYPKNRQNEITPLIDIVKLW